MDQLNKTERTSITRLPNRGSYDRKTIVDILNEALVCHISYVFEEKPFTIPHLYAVKKDKIYIHGSVGSFMLRALQKEIDLCFSVTLIDGLVLARSAFHHSVNYRSVVLFGKATIVEDEVEKLEALEALTEHVIPGRYAEVRKPSINELKQTIVLSIPLEEASAKIRTGNPGDEEEDYNLEVWAGVLPLKMISTTPISDPKLKKGLKIPSYIVNYKRGEL